MSALHSRIDDWQRQLPLTLETTARFDAMARKWFRDKGKDYPGDPGAPLVQIIIDAAAGQDVSSRLVSVLR
jgi:uncharacterized protein (DUF924 family)